MGIKDFVLDKGLLNFRHEEIQVSEWDDQKVIIKALGLDDWDAYEEKIKALKANKKKEPDGSMTIEAFSLVIARTLYDPETRQRVFTDADVPEIKASFAHVHDRLVAKAFELSGLVAGKSGNVLDQAAKKD